MLNQCRSVWIKSYFVRHGDAFIKKQNAYQIQKNLIHCTNNAFYKIWKVAQRVHKLLQQIPFSQHWFCDCWTLTSTVHRTNLKSKRVHTVDFLYLFAKHSFQTGKGTEDTRKCKQEASLRFSFYVLETWIPFSPQQDLISSLDEKNVCYNL